MDQKDLFSFFLHIRGLYNEEEIYSMLENYEVTKLDINRIYRYLDKYTQKTLHLNDDDDVNKDSDYEDLL
jgi:hypothetical protein